MRYLRVNAPKDSQGQSSAEDTANPEAMAGYINTRWQRVLVTVSQHATEHLDFWEFKAV